MNGFEVRGALWYNVPLKFNLIATPGYSGKMNEKGLIIAGRPGNRRDGGLAGI
jgi:hypothetical protein